MAARLDDVEHAVHIDIETEPRVLAQRQCQETGQRKHTVDTVERIEQLMQPCDVAAHDPHPLVLREKRGDFRRAQRVIVEQHDLARPRFEQLLGDVRADQARAAGQQKPPAADLHDPCILRFSRRLSCLPCRVKSPCRKQRAISP
jgi:hypothetical protein